MLYSRKACIVGLDIAVEGILIDCKRSLPSYYASGPAVGVKGCCTSFLVNALTLQLRPPQPLCNHAQIPGQTTLFDHIAIFINHYNHDSSPARLTTASPQCLPTPKASNTAQDAPEPTTGSHSILTIHTATLASRLKAAPPTRPTSTKKPRIATTTTTAALSTTPSAIRPRRRLG